MKESCLKNSTLHAPSNDQHSCYCRCMV